MSNSRPLAAWMVMIVTFSPWRALVIVHDQADMLEEGAERFIFLHRAGELGEVFEAAGAFGRAVGLEHRGVAALVEHDAGELGMGQLARHLPPAGDVGDEIAEAAARLRGQLVAVEQGRGGEQQRLLRGAGVAVDGGDRLVAEAALGRVDDALEGEVVGRLGDQAEVGEGVADLGALVEAEAADDLVGEADRDEALLELAGLELGADEDGDVVEASRPSCMCDSISSPTRRASSGPSQTPMTRTFSPSPASVHRVLPRRPALWAMRPSAAARMWRGRAVILLEPDDLRAGEVLLEAQDVGDLGAAPGIDRLVVVADAAEVAARLGEQLQPFVLGLVGVLIFVDEDVAEAVAIGFEHVGVGAEDDQHVEQQVAEVAGVQGASAAPDSAA